MTQLIVQECKGRHVSLHHPQGSMFCDACGDYVLTDWRHRCQCCFRVIVKKRNFLTQIKKLDIAVEANKRLLDCYIANPPTNTEYMPGVVIQFGYRNYLVSLSYLAEYYKLPRSRNPDLLKPILNRIETHSMLLMPGTKVIS